MKTLLISIVIAAVAMRGEAQTKFHTPEGFAIFKDYDNNPFKLEKDLDGDGRKDVVVVYSKIKSEDEQIVAVYLSTSSKTHKRYFHFPFSSNSYSLEFKNKVLIVGSCFGNGRYCKTLKFKFYPALKNMRLIGYDEESFGNAIHEGAYFKSVNLLTNKYEISGPKWKDKVVGNARLPILTLKNINENIFDQLANIGESYLTD